MSPKGIYSAQWSVLRYLNIHGPSTQITMSSYLNVEAPTMTRTIKRLEQMELIKRNAGKDRRENIIQLTEMAKKKITEWEKDIAEFEDPLLEEISFEDIETTKKVLQHLITKLKD